MEFVTFNIAKKLKEKGFDWETSNVYERNTLACRYEDYPKPTIAQAFKWLREEKKHHIIIDYNNALSWNFLIYKFEEGNIVIPTEEDITTGFNSYEGAALNAIEYVLDKLI